MTSRPVTSRRRARGSQPNPRRNNQRGDRDGRARDSWAKCAWLLATDAQRDSRDQHEPARWRQSRRAGWRSVDLVNLERRSTGHPWRCGWLCRGRASRSACSRQSWRCAGDRECRWSVAKQERGGAVERRCCWLDGDAAAHSNRLRERFLLLKSALSSAAFGAPGCCGPAPAWSRASGAPESA